ncbi:PREDICTED: LOW QUALITY PROTEIN [Prunus dulcis]|uniref:PREDICTED: LOW QUALITY PROTEIN n=1 Tax=Prunus dulcis TaxID=3755 RepID=A0A5E4F2Y3_PRUDU|nr:PREDICTED: LOW QUALITY PROTEIN [Prunus dulcis]
MGMTENNSPTYLSSGNPCLDFFFHVVPDTLPSYLDQQLPLAWAHDSLTTLKLICNLRGVRGFGKSDKEGFYTVAFWLHQNHPKTLACNLASFAQFGCFRDLPEILYRVLRGQDVREMEKAEWLRIKGSGKRGRRGRIMRTDGTRRDKSKSKAKRVKEESREVRINKSLERHKLEKEKARALRTEKMVAMAKKALNRYRSDSDYQFLHDQISDLFAECLKSDMECLKRNNYITLAAKWCPSIYSSFDRATLLCESIPRKVFPRELYPEYEGIDDENYAYRVRDRLKKEVLVPLRKAMELPEVFTRNSFWSTTERFSKYLEDVKAGKSKIAAGALLPHEIIAQLNIGLYDHYSFESEPNENGDVDDQVAELQWKRMVDDMLKQGNMNNCLAVCDVSASMGGTPMEVSVALGLLVSELSEEPLEGKVITFSQNPQLHLIKGDDLSSKCKFVRRMEWGMNTDFQKVFDLLLQVAVNGNLKPEHMIKRIFVFSDMEFDQASSNSWETDYEAIQRKFKEKGTRMQCHRLCFGI